MTRLMYIAALALALTACASKPQPQLPVESSSEGNEPSNSDVCADSEPSTPTHCECLGGYVKGDIGDGKVACAEGETELERVQQGIEGAVCCKAP